VRPLHLLVRVVLVGMLALLTSLAYASPPDPSWISGLWDDGDHDDVVIRVIASAGVVEPFPLDDACSMQLVTALLYHMDESSTSKDASSVIHARAPPSF
jgi:hypothetical protein